MHGAVGIGQGLLPRSHRLDTEQVSDRSAGARICHGCPSWCRSHSRQDRDQGSRASPVRPFRRSRRPGRPGTNPEGRGTGSGGCVVGQRLRLASSHRQAVAQPRPWLPQEPAGLTRAQAAAVPQAGEPAVMACTRWSSIEPGDAVLVQRRPGAAPGRPRCRSPRRRVPGWRLSTPAWKLHRLPALGADEGVDYRREEGLSQATAGRRVCPWN